MENIEQRKLLSALCHGSIFLGSMIFPVVIPLIILFVTKDSVVKANARESINFYINFYIYGLIAGALTIILIGFLILPIVVLISIAMPIIALVKVLDSPDEPYRYPFIFRLV